MGCLLVVAYLSEATAVCLPCLSLSLSYFDYFSGAECIPDDSNGHLKYKCDCGSIHMPFHHYAGDFCELKSTELCTYNGRPGSGLNKDAFCVK